ncbi:glycine zipper 2TM domain-containing protein [Pelomonas sp. KK5]|uniref:glycine zipper 2TM domain-containing protein n=1 Tax=Pelomonas sp. KK5 TaxID=1855730 RepID=UPI00097BBF6A|nr:glycine zipper 2TM domain-containing protein [Pelomonas sp. KK5]
MNVSNKQSLKRHGGIVLTAVLAISLSACAGMSRRESSALVGTAVGGVVGAAATGGSTVGTVGGAVAGGVIGNELGKKR